MFFFHLWLHFNITIQILSRFFGDTFHFFPPNLYLSLRFERCVPFFLSSGSNLCKVKEVHVECGSPSRKIDANLLKIHHWPGFNMAKCGCKWEGRKSTLSLQINLSCRLSLINTTACHKSCSIAVDGNYCIYLSHSKR